MEISDFFRIYQNAAWNKDSEAMISLYDEQALIYDMWDQGYLPNSFEWESKIREWLVLWARKK